MAKQGHEYAVRVEWIGAGAEGTARYTSYSRRHRVSIAGKPDLEGTADPAYRGESDRHNPEDLFVSAIAACHMLTYLGLCARRGVRVVAYEDQARGVLVSAPGGGGRFEEITLRPAVTLAAGADVELAMRLHETAHGHCILANSCAAPIRCQATVEVQPGEGVLA